MAWFDDLELPGSTITGHFGFVHEDGPDEDDHPDIRLASGTVRFEPTATAVKAGGAWIGIAPVEAQVFDGELIISEDDPNPPRILSTDADTGVENWGWKATFDIRGANIKPVTFKAPETGVHLTSGDLIPITGQPVEIIAGPPGDSAYDVAVEQGYEGTESDWLDSLVGPGGPRGPEGPYGGTEVTDPQVASYVTGDTETREALDASYRRGVSVLEYGATGDGETDDTDAFQAALDAGRPVHVPEGDYLVSGATTGSPLDLHLAQGATIHHVDGQAAIHVHGSEGEPVEVSDPVEPGDKTVVAPGHGIVAGDWLRVASERVYDASSTNMRHGELIEVAEVDGDTLTTVTAIAGGPYTPEDDARVTRLDLVDGVSITGAGVVAGSRTPGQGQTGIRVTLAQNVHISGITTRDIDYRHIGLEDVAGGLVSGINVKWAHSPGMGYGIAPTNAAQDILVTGCSFTDARHAFTTSNQAAIPGVVRRVTVESCTVRYSSPATGGSPGDGLDTHTAAEDITFRGNTVIGASGLGVNMECRSGRIVGNTIIRPGGGGISFHNESDQHGNVEIVGNRIVAPGHYAIRVMPPSRGSTAEVHGVTVSGNTVEDGPVTPIYIGTTGGALTRAVQVHGNTAISCGGSRMVSVVNAAAVAHSGSVAYDGSSTAVIEDSNTGTGDDPGFRIASINDGTATVLPTTKYLRLGSSSGDVLSTITGGSRGQIIIVRLASSSGSVVVDRGSGRNIATVEPLTLEGANDTLTLAYNGTTWVEVARAKF